MVTDRILQEKPGLPSVAVHSSSRLSAGMGVVGELGGPTSLAVAGGNSVGT